MSRGPAERAGKLTDMEAKGELENDDATVPRGSTEQAGKFPSIGKNSKSKEGEGRKEGGSTLPAQTPGKFVKQMGFI